MTARRSIIPPRSWHRHDGHPAKPRASWQLRRLDQKTAQLPEIQAGIDAAPVPLPAVIDPSMKYMPVIVSGQTTGQEILVLSGTKERGGGVGNVISAFVTEDGRRILPDRGFIEQDYRRTARPATALSVAGNLHWPQDKQRDARTGPEGDRPARDVPARRPRRWRPSPCWSSRPRCRATRKA